MLLLTFRIFVLLQTLCRWVDVKDGRKSKSSKIERSGTGGQNVCLRAMSREDCTLVHLAANLVDCAFPVADGTAFDKAGSEIGVSRVAESEGAITRTG